jgi:hypothetical protein
LKEQAQHNVPNIHHQLMRSLRTPLSSLSTMLTPTLSLQNLVDCRFYDLLTSLFVVTIVAIIATVAAMQHWFQTSMMIA